MKFKNNYNYKDLGILIIRIGVGLMYIFVHGSKKIFSGIESWEKYGKAMNNFGIEFLPAFWGFMASIAEFFGGILILLGFLFRPAAVLLLLTMIVASSYHIGAGQGISSAAHAMKMAVVFLGFLFIGPGKYSIDQWIADRFFSEK